MQQLERLGDSFDVTGRRKKARQSYQRAIDHVSTQDHLRQAHLYRKIAFTWHDPPNPTEALRFQQEAERFLNLVPGEHSPAWWQEWVQIQLDQCWLLYRLGQAREMTELIEKTQKPVEQYGTADQRAAFFIYAVLRNFARDRYVALEETTAFSEEALKASLKSVDPSTIGNAQLMLGCCRLWDGRFDEAEELLQAALALAERIGNITLQVRCLNVLSLVYRRRGQVEEVQRYASRMQAMQAPEYLGVVKAHQAWIAWRAGTYAEVQEYSKEAFQLWERSPLVYYYQWTALWPMMGVALAEKRGADAVKYAGMLPCKAGRPINLRPCIPTWSKR